MNIYEIITHERAISIWKVTELWGKHKFKAQCYSTIHAHEWLRWKRQTNPSVDKDVEQSEPLNTFVGV